MRFWYQNLIDPLAVVISATSATAGLPASNVANEQKSIVWRTGTSIAAENVTFDLGAPTAVTTAIIFAHTLTNSDSLIQVRGSTDNFAASDNLISSFTWSSGPMTVTFGTNTYRYWRIAFTKSAAGVTRDIGRIFIGNYVDTTEPPDFAGVQITDTDLSVKQRSVGGQQYTDRRSVYRTIQADFTTVSTALKDQYRAIYAWTQEALSFFTQIDPTPGTTEAGEIVYVKFAYSGSGSAASVRKVEGVDSDLLWTYSMVMEEQL